VEAAETLAAPLDSLYNLLPTPLERESPHPLVELLEPLVIKLRPLDADLLLLNQAGTYLVLLRKTSFLLLPPKHLNPHPQLETENALFALTKKPNVVDLKEELATVTLVNVFAKQPGLDLPAQTKTVENLPLLTDKLSALFAHTKKPNVVVLIEERVTKLLEPASANMDTKDLLAAVVPTLRTTKNPQRPSPIIPPPLLPILVDSFCKS